MLSWFVDRAYAYTVNLPIAKDDQGNPITTYASFGGYLVDLIKFAVNIAFGLAVLMIIFGAFKYVTSGGDEAKTKDGKDIILSAVIGFAILVLIRILVPILGIQ